MFHSKSGAIVWLFSLCLTVLFISLPNTTWTRESLAYTVLHAANPDVCQYACQLTGDCAGFTWTTPMFKVFPTTCALFTSTQNTSTCHQCVSGPKDCSPSVNTNTKIKLTKEDPNPESPTNPCYSANTTWPASSLTDLYLASHSPEDCQAACEARSGCEGFTWTDSSFEVFPLSCGLFGSVQQGGECQHCISGPRQC